MRNISYILIPCFALACTRTKDDDGGNGATATPTPTYNYGTYNSMSTGGTACVPGNCPPCSLDATSTGGTGKTLSAIAGQASTWTFTGSCPTDSTRQVVAYHIAGTSTLPSTMTISGDKSSSVSVAWTPKSSDPSTGTLQVTLRDIGACNAAQQTPVATNVATPLPGVAPTPTPTVATAVNCTDYNTVLTTYESTVNFQFLLSNTTNTTNNSTTTNGGTSLGTILAIGAGIGALQGVLNGGFKNPSGIFNSALSGVFGALGGAGQMMMGGGYAQGVYGIPYGYPQNGMMGGYTTPIYGQMGYNPNGQTMPYGNTMTNCAMYTQQQQCQQFYPQCTWNGYSCAQGTGTTTGGAVNCSTFTVAQCAQYPQYCYVNGSYCQNR